MTAQTTAATRLTVPTDIARFDLSKDKLAESKLSELLESSHKNTLVIAITKPEDIYFDSTARLQGRYKLSAGSLANLCSRLLPGLAQTINNLAGSKLTDEQLAASSSHNPTMAVKWLNEVIRLRFNRVKGYSLIVDSYKKVVEGFVGRKYAYLSNLDLYNKATEFVSTAKRPAQFCEAVLQGRRLMLRYKDTEPLFAIEKATGVLEPFYGGFHFANSESGDCSIKASSVLIREWGNTKAVSDFADGSKIAHVKGRQFDLKFTDLLDRLKFKSEEIVSHKNSIQRLMRTSLHLGKTPEAHSKAIKLLERRLIGKGLPYDFVQSTIRHLLVHGSYKNDTISSDQEPMTVFERRNLFDLYNALGHRAKFLEVDEQELAEQVAFKLLTNKF